MSAYMIDRNHVAYLVTAATAPTIGHRNGSPLRWRHNGVCHQLGMNDTKRAAQAGQMLWDENHASVCHRYPDDGDNLPGPIGEGYVYRQHTPAVVELDPLQVIKAAHCYRYQACEHDGWEGSEASAFIDSLIDACTHALPGYDDAEWGAPEAMPNPINDTPAMKQYRRFKEQHPGCLLLFRMGDFYEMFYDDAETAHKTLGITLTQRTKGIPMAGVPYHSVEGYLRRLIQAGHRCAVCEQVD